jgi:hypothetical protein
MCECVLSLVEAQLLGLTSCTALPWPLADLVPPVPFPAAKGTNPWTGKSKVEIKRTPLPANWRAGL